MQKQLTLDQLKLLYTYTKLREYFEFPDCTPTEADYYFAEKLLSKHSITTLIACFRGLVLSHKYPIGNFKPEICARLSFLSEKHHIVEVSADRWNYYYTDHDGFLKEWKLRSEFKNAA